MSSPDLSAALHIGERFRGFLPVVVDVETGGFDPQRHALLEIAAVIPEMDAAGRLHPATSVAAHVVPFDGAELDPKAMEVNRIRLDSALRGAVPERDALVRIFHPIRAALRASGCRRAILVGHNAHFDLSFVNAAAARCGYKRNPFHPFSCLDTVSLAGLAFGQTVLARAVEAAGLEWDAAQAHSAVYDCERTAALFCLIVNRWREIREPALPAA